jgi:DnaD/phage-associated family protein
MPLPWIKLYVEILEDPKMGKMSEWLFARCIRLFLLAGREGKDGMLPPVEDIAWSLRIDEDKTAQTLRDLAEVGVTHQTEDGSWCITNFAKRQAISDGAKRVKEYRERKKQHQQDVTCNDTVTLHASYSPSSSLSSSLSDSPSSLMDCYKSVFMFYTSNIGALTSFVADEIKGSVDDFTSEWVIEAMKEAVKNEARNWKYVEAILKNWKTHGFKASKSGSNGIAGIIQAVG